jgi:hypothetical protein
MQLAKLAIATLTAAWLSTPSSSAWQPSFADSDGDLMPDTWEQTNNLNDADLSDGPLDADGDGIANVLEYAYGSSPLASNVLAKPVMGIDRSGPYSTVTFNRRVCNLAVVTEPQGATNAAGPWSAEEFILTNSIVVDDMEQVTYRSRYPITNGMRFVRLFGRPGSAIINHVQTLIDGEHQHGQGIAVADIDRDGDNDVLLGMSMNNTIRLYLNGGNTNGGGDASTWATNALAPEGTLVAMRPTVADIDRDGDLDVSSTGLTGFGGQGGINWFENPGNPLGSWTTHVITNELERGYGHAVADLTGDGAPDILAGQVAGNGGLTWWRNSGNGSAWTGATTIDGTLADVENILAHDVDKDGVTDIVAHDVGGNAIYWYENGRAPGTTNNNPTFTRHTIASLTAPRGISLTNIDADVDYELFVASGDGVLWLDPPPDPTTSWDLYYIDAGFVGVSICSGDFNLDGRVDAGVISQSSEEVRWYANDGGGLWTGWGIASGFFGLSFIQAGDVSRDGRPDLVTSTYNNGATDRLDWWRNDEY